MPLVQWENNLTVYIDELDNQHKTWLDIINELHDAMIKGKSNNVLSTTLNRLKDYTTTHFNTEEKYLEKYNYPEIETHKTLHKNFMTKINQIVQKYEQCTTISCFR